MSVGNDARRLTDEKMNRARGIATMYEERRAYMDALEIINQCDELVLPVTTPVARATLKIAIRGVVDALTDDLLGEMDALE